MLSFFLAHRYLAQAAQTKATASILTLSVTVLFIGSLALSLALSITQAFEEKVFERLQGINATALIYSYGQKIDPVSLSTFLKNKHPDALLGTTPQSAHSVIITKGDQQSVITLRGISPKTENAVTNLSEKIVAPKNTSNPLLDELLDKNNALIGHSLAQRMAINVGDTITFFVPDTSTTSKRIKLTEYAVKISGFFNIGLEEFDGASGFCSLHFFNEIFKITKGADSLLLAIARQPLNKPTTWLEKFTLLLKSNNPFGSNFQDTVVAHIKKELSHVTVASWKELYPALLSAMKLEKCAIIGIIILLTLVSLMNVISTLFTLVNRKQRDIALFQAIGMPNCIIRNIFIWMGIGMIGLSSFLGAAAGWIISFILETYKCVPLPEGYYIHYLPAATNPLIFISVPLITVALGFVIIVVSVRHVQKIDALDVLRHTA